MNEKQDRIEREPQITGRYGRAWQYDLDLIRSELKIDPTGDAGLVGWLVEAPYAHMLWHSYTLLLLHLRPLPGVPGPHIHLADATHEMQVWAMNPEMPRQPTLDGKVKWGDCTLSPMNFGAQFIATDEAAVLKIKESVRMVVEGQISPDTDYVLAWAEVYGYNMIKGLSKHTYN